MQRYRINYRLLFGVLAGSFFVAVLAFFVVHPWQVNRKATWYLERAEQALSENNLRDAFDYQHKYVRYREDEEDARIKLAHIALDLSKLDGATNEDFGNAYLILDDTVRRTSDAELRRLYADMLMSFGRPQDALVHIQVLQEDDPNNTEIQALRVRALFLTKDYSVATELALGLIGYDKKSEKFVAEKAVAADQPEIYSLLAGTLYNKDNTRELSRRVIDQLVEANPDSHDAHLRRSFYLHRAQENEEARIELEKAYELAPTDSLVLQRKGQVALIEKDFDAAKAAFSKALELYPDKIAFYQLLAQTATQQNQLEDALAILDQGIEKFTGQQLSVLLIFKLDLLFATRDLPAFKEEVDSLSKIKGNVSSTLLPLVDYQRARIKFLAKNWPEAAKELERVRPLLFNAPKEQAQAGVLLGNTYEQLGKLDLALESYELVLQSQPQFAMAQAGLRRVRQQIRPDDVSDSDGLDLNRIIQKMLDLPEAQQDWNRVDEELAKAAEERGVPAAHLALQRAQIFLEREMYSDAKRLIQDAAKLEPENVRVRFAAVKLLLRDPDGGPEKALRSLEKTVARFGISPGSRMLRIETLIALGGENAAKKINALTEGTEEWSPGQQAQLHMNLGVAFQQLNLASEAMEHWNIALKLAPNNLPLSMRVFDLALQQRNDDAILDAQQQILTLVGNKGDASYILTEVKRRLMGFSLGKNSREEVLEARGMLDAALTQRPEWGELHILYGQLLILLNEDEDLALQHLNDALKYGPTDSRAVGLQVKMLSKRGHYEEARERMEKLPQAIRSKVLGSVEAEILSETGDTDAAYELAEKIALAQPDVAKTQQWFAKLAQKSGRMDAAADALHRVTELSPQDVDSWSQLLTLYALQKDTEKLRTAFREAQLSLDAEFLPLLAAKSFELRGLWRHAERIYLAAFADRFDDVAIARRLADFYLVWSRAEPSNLKKASSFINRILRANYEGKIPADHPQAAWARNQAARQLASTRNYQDSLKAQQLLTQGTSENKLSIADQALLAEILASLNDPASQGKAIRILTELYENSHLQKKGVLMLAQLLRNANEWDRCEDLMVESLSTFGADAQVWSIYVGMLIDRGEYSEAQSRINRLKQLAPQSASYIQLLAQLASKKGDQALVRKTLTTLLPKNRKGTLSSKQLQTIRGVAQLATQCENYELARELLQLYVQRLPEENFALLQFQALHGDAEAAIAAMKKGPSSTLEQVLALSATMLRTRRAELEDRYDEDINQILATALRDAPDSTRRLLIQAEILEIQQKYKSSIEAYDNLLKRSNLPPIMRAAAMNNLAYMLAMRGERLDEAEQLVNQSMEIYGPIDDLLDTRALARTANEKHELAVEDLTLAVSVSRDPLKYYHLARAKLLAGDKPGALISWKEAEDLGFDKEKLPLLEQPGYEEFEIKLGQSE